MGHSCFSHLSLIHSLFTLCLFVVAATDDHHLSGSLKRAQTRYKQFSLSSKINGDSQYEPLANASKIVEKHFRFYKTGGPNVRDFGRFGGYVNLPNTNNTRMFYYFFESRINDVNAPVVVYLSGGPGCSGSVGVFYLDGPFHLTKNLSLVWNDFGLDKESNIIYVDQPTGTGFSYSTSERDIRRTSEEAGVDFYYFLQAFFEKHSKYVKNDLYIVGGSYAGHYIPAFANQVQKGNKKNQGPRIHINLKGIAMGSAWTYPGLQFTAYPRYALNMKRISRAQYDNRTMAERFSRCRQQVQKDCDDGTTYNFTACGEVYINCNNILSNYITKSMGDTSVYDIRKKCNGSVCNDFSDMERFLNLTSVKEALGVETNMPFVTCSDKVYDEMLGDQMRNVAVYIPALLQDGIKLLVYGGEFDFLCNWQGNLLWVYNMRWWGRRGFRLASTVPFEVHGAKAGLMKSYGPLTFLTVKDAGHLVLMDQPEVSFEVLTKWIKGISL